ncbi:thermonuclease family protein [Nodularia spumigena]|uniref:Thermonuclease family protein n=1 Tax=Nodularia spumigena UHCC 0060 TaxID=3110300 RepID=A0ABU5URK9_NODSP|nr:thermonuclease family protein [Nodularia spumigena]MEA5525451.1 thermonuclease family protein [Nodularia spumigena UHCC 0143]MEA5608767.1 thermonuclease family protein [Nodularia spumigena UHCC 0060]MEA5615183.1 thermonuclease family protein [Nodularia spumigena UHCC 0040]
MRIKIFFTQRRIRRSRSVPKGSRSRRVDAKGFFGVLVRKIVLFGSLLLLVSCQVNNQTASNQVQVKVARVVSGQSLDVLGMAEQPNLISRVRLVGIDAPDFQQRPWGDESRQVLETLIGEPEKPVILEFDVSAKDKMGRTLAYVWKDQQLLNEEVLKQGYAIFVGRSPNHKYDQRLERAQQWARLIGKGIWNPENPMRLPPAEFRRRNL